MVNSTFWSTMAEVSATFVGLVFVGLSLYLAGIRTAVSEMEAELGMEEQSSRVMFVSVLSNLVFFVLPLIASLSLIAQTRLGTPSLFWLSAIICLLLLGALLCGHENGETRQQVKLILSESAQGKALRLRLEYAKWLLYLVVLIYVVLLAAIFGWPPISQAEDWLKGAVFLSIVFGLICGVLDLILFDVDNILFHVSDRARDRLGRMQYDLKTEMQGVEILYHQYDAVIRGSGYQDELLRLMRDPGVIAMLNPTRIQEQAQAEQVAIRSAYNRLREEIPIDGEVEIVRQFRTKGKVVTYADMRTLNEQGELLSKDIGSLKELLDGRLEFFERRGIRTDGAS